MRIKRKEERPKMLGGACCPSNLREVERRKVMVEYEREAGWTNKYEDYHLE
jgi:hypothetical protein